MNTIINLSAGAYMDRNSPNSNFKGATVLKSGFPTFTKKPTSTFDKLIVNNPYVWYTALLQFLIPASLKYKKITSVSLVFSLSWNHDMSLGNSGRNMGAYDMITPYVYGGDLSSITWNTFRNLGTVGEPLFHQNMKYFDDVASGTDQVAVDVTAIFTNNLSNGSSGQLFNVLANLHSATSGYISLYASTPKPYLSIDYEDVPQLPPTLSYPNDVFLREGQAVLFSWQHNSETAAVQQSYTLEYKTIGASSYTVVNGGREHSYTLQGGLPAGDYVWRVKIVNDAGETSDYSAEASFSVVGKPASPVIGTPENKALTRIEWNASDQNAFDLTLTDSDGRTIVNVSEAGNSSRYAVNQFLKGTYTVGIRIKNSIDLWSDWSYKTFTIDAEAPAAPNLIIQIDGTGVRLTAEDVPDGARIAFLRSENGGDYKVIAVDETDFVDRKTKARTKYTYIVRAFADGFADSDPSSAAVMLDGMCLNSEGLELHLTVSSDKYLAIGETVSKETSVTNYSGREYALVERGEFTTWELERRFFVTEEQREVLEKFLDVNSAFYRDSRGRAFACAVLSIKYNEYMDEGYIVTISLTRIDEEEVIINV